ncbi:hypothetical protein AAVH_09076 [Aphelenchoides avenae]|nr:hypothetical protein AAVH_09076 [Aphelenchus avenae]
MKFGYFGALILVAFLSVFVTAKPRPAPSGSAGWGGGGWGGYGDGLSGWGWRLPCRHCSKMPPVYSP